MKLTESDKETIRKLIVIEQEMQDSHMGEVSLKETAKIVVFYYDRYPYSFVEKVKELLRSGKI